MLTIPRNSSHLNRPMLAVTASTLASAAILTDVAALSPELCTPLLLVTHIWVKYCWQNSRFRPAASP